MKGDPLETLKKILKFEIFEQCHSAENCKRGTLWDFLTSIVLQNIKKIEGETLWWNPTSFKKKSHSAEKNPSEKRQRWGGLCYRGSVRQCFCFGRASGVSSMFWTSVVQVDDVEQMNKKVDRSR